MIEEQEKGLKGEGWRVKGHGSVENMERGCSEYFSTSLFLYYTYVHTLAISIKLSLLNELLSEE